MRRSTARSRRRLRDTTLQITVSGNTAAKFIDFLHTQKTSRNAAAVLLANPRVRPTLRPWVEVIDRIIQNDAGLPKRVRTSAVEILQILRDKHGYKGCYNVVQEYIRRRRNPGAASSHSRKARTQKEAIEIEKPPQALRREATQADNRTAFEDRSPQDESAHSVGRATMVLKQLRRHQPDAEPAEQAIDWMRKVQQGAVPLDLLIDEITVLPCAELEILVNAARTGKLSVRNRSMALMSYARGIACPHICSFLEISSGSFYRYLELFRSGGTTKLLTRKERKDKQSNNEAFKAAVFALLHSPPSAQGVNRTTWTIAELVRILSTGSYPAGADTVRAIIKESGFKWRHAKVVLTSNDPDYRAKVVAITKILAELKEHEAFCSIDEYGPFAIKIKGGKKRVAPGEQYVVPQWQKSKGWLILTAALELKHNQVTHFYSRKKDTNEMIRMADTLRSQYRSCQTVYLSWDAASWHVSKRLLDHLKLLNDEALLQGFPIIKTAPLPAGAQFLNVIESVFSGMARAIIHNSDYPSPEATKDAIDRYLADRNSHFAAHPKRAGQKIWGKERVLSVFSEGQNCKDPLYQFIT